MTKTQRCHRLFAKERTRNVVAKQALGLAFVASGLFGSLWLLRSPEGFGLTVFRRGLSQRDSFEGQGREQSRARQNSGHEELSFSGLTTRLSGCEIRLMQLTLQARKPSSASTR